MYPQCSNQIGQNAIRMPPVGRYWSFHTMIIYKIISFASFLMHINETITCWRSHGIFILWGLIGPTCALHPRTISHFSMMRNFSVVPTKAQKLLSPKLNPFGLHEIAWFQWQPIGCGSSIFNLSSSFACGPQIFRGKFPSSTDSRGASSNPIYHFSNYCICMYLFKK